jgi:hypothetical protein
VGREEAPAPPVNPKPQHLCSTDPFPSTPFPGCAEH